ncbi:MAG: hypothetical protein DIZ80_08350 [endosymbiont of Galathealinum brachiosum]|uniref:histidine kinase n=1 Tax=endosymbiont of Galathealinum brachiosum TaxID=2200906 RepID=A0A370DBQ1_9GAMM|nr:MAG: hypothetical protein DIZ80_08350 [endosymbiont of Galathealinum brachiosum]
MKKWFLNFANAGCLETDTESERLKKAILVTIPTGISIAAMLWSLAYLYLERPISAAIPGGYSLISMMSILLFIKTKYYSFFRFSQLFLILWLPFLLQWSLGGFHAGSSVMVWAILSPVGALMFHGVRPAIPWFIAYLLLTVISGVFDSYFKTLIEPLSTTIITTFYVMNLGTATLLMYAVVNYFVIDNNRIISDVSREKEKAENSKAVIEEQAIKLIEMDQIRSRFLANVSHEFRTPLALTIGPLEDALEGRFGEFDKILNKQLQVILRNSRRLLRLVNQLLDISKVEAGEMKVNLQNIDINHFIREISLAFTPYAERKNIGFTTDLGNHPINIKFDPDKIEKVINNLLSNAVKFTPDNGRVRLTLKENNEGIEITLRDSGPGIAKKDISHIFDRFYQVDGSSTREHEGTGIGLSLVKELIELHQGTTEVTSETGFGSEFKITLPFNTGHSTSSHNPNDDTYNLDIEMASMDIESMTDIKANANLDKKLKDTYSILIVDDNKDIRDYLNSCLKSQYHVVQAEDGIEGLKTAKQYNPDLIISDIMMPRMDGYEFCKSIKSDIQLNHTPLIFLTAKASEDMKIQGLEVGADDYLSKPFSAKELLARVSNLITLRQQEKQLKQLNLELEGKVKDQLDELITNKRLNSYFSGKMLQQLLNNEEAAALITRRKKVTILFSDLCNFTDLTDRLESEQTTLILNQYLTEMTALVEKNGGTVIQIIGDAIMAFFGAPEEMDDKVQAINAMNLGIDMQAKIKNLSNNWLSQGIEYSANIRIGIHQDFVTVGNFGSSHFMEYTAVGKGVNLASRLETSCNPGKIKVSYPVYLLARDDFSFGELSEEIFKGFSRKIKVCEYTPSLINS